MININENLFNILRLIDDENPEIQMVVNQELKKNSLELILNKEEYKVKLKKDQRENFDLLLNYMHLDLVSEAFNILMNNSLEDIDLESSIIMLSYWNDFNVNCQSMKNELDNIANSIRMPKTGHPLAFIDHISSHLFNEFKISGSSEEHCKPENFYLNRLLETKKGIPISMSILYILISNRLGFPVLGVPIPGNFMLKFFNDEDEIFFDPFYAGKKCSRKMCYDYLKNINTVEKADLILKGCSNFDIIVVVLKNLRMIYSSHHYNPDKLQQIESFQEMFQDHYATLI